MLTKIQSAMYFATQEHVIRRSQLYGGVLPYTHHLQEVAGVLLTHLVKADEDLIVSAWLHDVIEDCEVKEKTIRELFGHRVGDIVAAVTNEPGENRKTRNLLTYPKIRSTEDAIIVKLADRLANTSRGGSLLQMYRKEYPTFRKELENSAVSCKEYEELRDKLWAHLDWNMREQYDG